MKLINRQTLTNEAAKRWKEQYCSNGEWYASRCLPREETYAKLLALGTNPNPNDVDGLIGDSSWTDVKSCNECDQQVDELVEIGEPSDYESSTAYVCKKCLLEALEMFK